MVTFVDSFTFLFVGVLFHWTFGMLEADYFGTVDVDTGKSKIFVPHPPPEYIVWRELFILQNTLRRRTSCYYTDEVGRCGVYCGIKFCCSLQIFYLFYLLLYSTSAEGL